MIIIDIKQIIHLFENIQLFKVFVNQLFVDGAAKRNYSTNKNYELHPEIKQQIIRMIVAVITNRSRYVMHQIMLDLELVDANDDYELITSTELTKFYSAHSQLIFNVVTNAIDEEIYKQEKGFYSDNILSYNRRYKQN